MLKKLLISAAALSIAAPAGAQMQMAGMHTPTPSKPASTKKAANKTTTKSKAPAPAKKSAAKKPVPRSAHKPAAKKAEPMDQLPTEHGGAASSAKPMTMPVPHLHETTTMPTATQPAPGGEMPTDQQHIGHEQMGQMPSMATEHAGHEDHMAMTGAFGSYPMTRESSGTAWQPDTSEHMGLHVISGDWTLMAHGTLNLVYDHQSGPRGDDKAFASGMLMGMARRQLGNGTLQFKAMLSPDPIMGPSGYPLLLASGETANGRDRLIDRQHPHDLFMELSASMSQNIGPKSSVFLYAGLPGEPAFGPPAFMHREAVMNSPEAPITHHWLDSTHISFGVLTGGIVLDRVKLEVSRFNGREPDQHRWNIETGPLDSTAIRISWNPTRSLALQGSWGHFVDPEQLEPGVNQKRWSASALWANEIAPGWKLAGTLAWGRKSAHGHNDDGFALEASLKHGGWTAFGRGEMTENRELVDLEEHGPAYRVGKISLGAVRDFRLTKHVALGAGGLFSVNFVPAAIATRYGGRHPTGAMGFVRLKLD